MVTYPGDWKKVSIDSLFDIYAGGDVKTEFYSAVRTAKYPFAIYSNGLENQGLYGYTSMPIYPGNSVTVTARGTIGYAFYREKPFDAVIRLLVLVPKNGAVYPKFYEYVINSQVVFEQENTGVPQLTVPKIGAKIVPYPSRREQEAIAETIAAFDTHISNLAALIEKKRAVRDAALEDLVSGRTRLAGFTEPWTESSLGSIGTFTKGAPLSKADISETGTPFILYGELYTTYSEVTYKVFRHTKKQAEAEHYSRIGDVIIPTSGETAEEIATACCVMIPDVILAGDLNIYRTSEMDGRFLSYVINHVVNRQISELAQGISIIHVNAKALGKIVVRYPSMKEQSAIVKIIDSMDEELLALEAEREKMTQIREGVMDDLLTGRKRLNQSHERNACAK